MKQNASKKAATTGQTSHDSTGMAPMLIILILFVTQLPVLSRICRSQPLFISCILMAGWGLILIGAGALAMRRHESRADSPQMRLTENGQTPL